MIRRFKSSSSTFFVYRSIVSYKLKRDVILISGQRTVINQKGSMNNSSSYGFEHLSECSSLDSTILTSTISIVSIVAFVGNTLVIVTFLLSPTLKTSTNYFIVNMAISDLLSSSTNWPLYATEGVQYSKPAIDGSTAVFVCKLGLYFRAVSQAVSVQSLLLIVVDRYIAIVLPFKSILVTARLRAALQLFTWVFALSIASPYASSSQIILENHQTFCRSFAFWGKKEKFILYVGLFAIFYCAPLISTIILYSRIMKCLRQTRPVEAEEEERTRMRNMQQNKTVMKVFVWIVSAFFISWTPLCVEIVLQKLFPSSRFTQDSCMIFASLFFYIFPSLSSIVNPIILFTYSSRFSTALRNLFACFTCGPCLCCRDRRNVPNEQQLARIQACNSI